MTTVSDRDLRYAILIDADNVSDKYIKIILDEVANSGIATYKRIYGDWTSPRLASWKSCLLDNSIIPMQQYSYTYGKNSTDSAMIIDAMDILYSGTVDGFAIVSSDSDFTRLVARLRESGMQVIGMGEQKTPKPFISACNQFKYLDLLYAAQKQSDAEDEEADAAEEASEAAARGRRRSRRGGKKAKAGAENLAEDTEAADEPDGARDAAPAHPRRRPGDMGAGAEPEAESNAGADAIEEDDEGEAAFGEMSRAEKRRRLKAIRSAITAVADTFSDDDGWVSLGQLGDQLGKRLPDFDVRNYGYKRLHPFLKSLGVYEFEEPSGESGRRQIYLREK